MEPCNVEDLSCGAQSFFTGVDSLQLESLSLSIKILISSLTILLYFATIPFDISNGRKTSRVGVHHK